MFKDSMACLPYISYHTMIYRDTVFPNTLFCSSRKFGLMSDESLQSAEATRDSADRSVHAMPSGFKWTAAALPFDGSCFLDSSGSISNLLDSTCVSSLFEIRKKRSKVTRASLPAVCACPYRITPWLRAKLDNDPKGSRSRSS